MKKHSILLSFGLAMLAIVTQAQDIIPSLPTAKKPRSTESTLTYRLGRQGVSMEGLNQVLQQTGYPNLANQFTVIGIAQEMSRVDKPLAFITQFDVGLKSGGAANQAVTNGTNTVRATYFQYGIGAGYRLIHTTKFTLTPKVTLSPTFFTLNITSNNAPAPSVAAALVNPGSQQTATFTSSTFVGDLGLSGQYRFPYSSRTKEITSDCGTTTITRERSLVLGFDAGYRFGASTRLNQSVNDQARNGSDNPAINLSGWYVTARFGFGTRYSR